MTFTLVVYFIVNVTAPWGISTVVTTLTVPGFHTQTACWDGARHVKASLMSNADVKVGDPARQIHHFDCMEVR